MMVMLITLSAYIITSDIISGPYMPDRLVLSVAVLIIHMHTLQLLSVSQIKQMTNYTVLMHYSVTSFPPRCLEPWI